MTLHLDLTDQDLWQIQWAFNAAARAGADGGGHTGTLRVSNTLMPILSKIETAYLKAQGPQEADARDGRIVELEAELNHLNLRLEAIARFENSGVPVESVPPAPPLMVLAPDAEPAPPSTT